MRDTVLIRFAAATFLSVSSILYAQSRPGYQPQPPASTMSPTTTTATAAPTTPTAPLTPAQSPPHRAEVSYANGELTISAANSSLNQILREISRLTGIKITGGVTEERVFGDYGPAPASEVLRTLLDGSGSNMLFIHATGDKPSELILTPRMGGPTPPNPNAAGFDDSSNDDDLPPRTPNRPNPPPRESQSTPAPPNATPQPITPPPADNSNSRNTPASDPTQSPNGVKTPQQIFEELQRLRQQQQAKPQ